MFETIALVIYIVVILPVWVIAVAWIGYCIKGKWDNLKLKKAMDRYLGRKGW